MGVTVLVPGVLRAECGGAAYLELKSAADLADVLDELAAGWPRLYRRVCDEQGGIRRFVNVYVDGEDCRTAGGLSAPVREGAEIQILPSVAGG